MKYYAIIRVRGRTGIKPDIKQTMHLLNLTRVNHCVVVGESEQLKGMLNVCKDYVAWGEIDKQTFAKMIEKRGRLPGNKRISQKYLEEIGYKNYDEFVDTIMNGKKLKDLGIKPVFRLRPPAGGYKRIKQAYPRGALGYRKAAINALLRRMI